LDVTLTKEAGRAAALLKATNRHVVFAESCTAGLVSSQLASFPGISQFHCGSLVTYRNRSKQDWLFVPAELLDDPGPVSDVVACAMATGALRRTHEADMAISVTGHLGPNAPAGFDGIIFIGVAMRRSTTSKRPPYASRHRLITTTRHQRQREAARLVLTTLCDVLEAADA